MLELLSQLIKEHHPAFFSKYCIVYVYLINLVTWSCLGSNGIELSTVVLSIVCVILNIGWLTCPVLSGVTGYQAAGQSGLPRYCQTVRTPLSLSSEQQPRPADNNQSRSQYWGSGAYSQYLKYKIIVYRLIHNFISFLESLSNP